MSDKKLNESLNRILDLTKKLDNPNLNSVNEGIFGGLKGAAQGMKRGYQNGVATSNVNGKIKKAEKVFNDLDINVDKGEQPISDLTDAKKELEDLDIDDKTRADLAAKIDAMQKGFETIANTTTAVKGGSAAADELNNPQQPQAQTQPQADAQAQGPQDNTQDAEFTDVTGQPQFNHDKAKADGAEDAEWEDMDNPDQGYKRPVNGKGLSTPPSEDMNVGDRIRHKSENVEAEITDVDPQKNTITMQTDNGEVYEYNKDFIKNNYTIVSKGSNSQPTSHSAADDVAKAAGHQPVKPQSEPEEEPEEEPLFTNQDIDDANADWGYDPNDERSMHQQYMDKKGKPAIKKGLKNLFNKTKSAAKSVANGAKNAYNSTVNAATNFKNNVKNQAMDDFDTAGEDEMTRQGDEDMANAAATAIHHGQNAANKGKGFWDNFKQNVRDKLDQYPKHNGRYFPKIEQGAKVTYMHNDEAGVGTVTNVDHENKTVTVEFPGYDPETVSFKEYRQDFEKAETADEPEQTTQEPQPEPQQPAQEPVAQPEPAPVQPEPQPEPQQPAPKPKRKPKQKPEPVAQPELNFDAPAQEPEFSDMNIPPVGQEDDLNVPGAEPAPAAKKKGRPAGSKNKAKDPNAAPAAPKKRGRPAGSKNKPKADALAEALMGAMLNEGRYSALGGVISRLYEKSEYEWGADELIQVLDEIQLQARLHNRLLAEQADIMLKKLKSINE